MDKIFSSEEDDEVVHIKENTTTETDTTEQTKQKKEIINRDVFWTGIDTNEIGNESTKINQNKEVDEFLSAFTVVKQEEDNKKPHIPSSLQKLNELSKGYRTKRNEFISNEDLYAECYPQYGKGEFARIDDKSGQVIHESIDLDKFELDKNKRKKKVKKDEWGSIQQKLKEGYGEYINDEQD
ncbi:hypothetical protein EHI8A_004020 [Entamoeba histolytica HM-1:IMSS-B]|uniref:Uncharacterized protein n=6 Tax=Entamoeba histolytica TaxID=5759 RepID=C4M1B7_ENTH1|nr:hypothetical protein EHI_169950 [Entamoeba histolytica HM-1:IMSS]EMD43672.1 Hypothetical protein EHI5A_016930 [Entamoeba histolytica KU27]EMH75520.1 hypothetical protein EHI8A_004020 [Entamoeba histolytica HM-1:IMSS-B]EMS16654.1 hypothetical protein KM1_017330 [Entamoeba histolytica HM-3:IMSS]ENY63497.1 hypothetical protein EHI7A_005760 [Entamoeba histolytica HM-1:IMSS-A]GAT94993.1 hypothetical protein CL6EHI_169950 [Entamoeba histolytica]|eukprot:XP_655997.1 hypothetical protein EHI_169950 [Entamoeba histolytica HM-1:IMSS]